MKKTLLYLLFISGLQSLCAQVAENTYKLNEMSDLLNEDVKELLDENLVDKRVVFLGEAEHHIGSDFLAKAEFVKYLVLEKGYKDIAFEGDFFGLYYDHDKSNLYSFWSQSVQCKELFEFLRAHKVTIWGFDNKMYSPFARKNFATNLIEFLEANSISYPENFEVLVESFSKNRVNNKKVLKSSEIDFLLRSVDELLGNEVVVGNSLWFQFIKNFKSDILINTTHRKSKKGIPIRDSQMAENLDFLVKTMPEKKFIVWLANAHMAKYEYDFMKGQTMGSQFRAINPNTSYHIAVSSIKMPYRKDNWLKKSSEDPENLLYFLPTIERNYFIDSKNLINEYPDYGNKVYAGMFNLNNNTTNWFKHFDALVFISKGEKVRYE